jgi:hypothetical protein
VYLHVDIASAPAAVELRDRENFGELSIRITTRISRSMHYAPWQAKVPEMQTGERLSTA